MLKWLGLGDFFDKRVRGLFCQIYRTMYFVISTGSYFVKDALCYL